MVYDSLYDSFLYPYLSKKRYDDIRLWGILSIVCIFISWGSVIVLAWVAKISGHGGPYFLVSDSNKVLAVVTAVCTFMFFKNLKIKNSVFINMVGSSTFGVLLIHANSDTMRRWLWRDTLNNIGYYDSAMLIPHAVVSVIGVYTVCTVIDQIRIWLFDRLGTVMK